jgi:hypothetical protein
MQLTDKDSFALQCKGGVVVQMDHVNFFDLSIDIVTKKFLISDIKYIVIKKKGWCMQMALCIDISNIFKYCLQYNHSEIRVTRMMLSFVDMEKDIKPKIVFLYYFGAKRLEQENFGLADNSTKYES